MSFRSAAGLVLAAIALVSATGCSGEPTPAPVPSSTVTAPQASLDGEWVLTRTVTASDDTTTPERAVGAESTRYVLIETPGCDAAACPGTVSSGAAPEGREQASFEVIDGGIRWAFDGALDCRRAETGAVLVVDAFTYDQAVELLVTDRADVDGTDTATRLEGTISLTDSLTTAGIDGGCLRDPITVNVSYSVVAVRSTGEVAPEDEG